MDSLTVAKKNLVANILEFFTEEIINNEVIEHDKQRLKEINACLKDIYSLDDADKPKLKKYNLLSIFLDQSISLEDATVHEAEHHKEVGDILMNEGSFCKALTQYTSAIRVNPTNATYFYNRALAFFELRKHAEAIHDCHKAIKLNPKYALAHSLLGSIYVKTENFKEALKSFEKCTVLEPRNAVYKEKLELVNVQIQNALASGSKNIKKSLGTSILITPMKLPALPLSLTPPLSPTSVVLPTETPEQIARKYIDLAEQEVNKNCYEQAAFYCTKAIEHNPNSAVYFCNRAEVHLVFGNNEACIEDCKVALTLRPDCGEAYHTIGIAFTNVRNFTDAFKAFTAALTYEPNSQKFKDDFRTAQTIYAEHLKAKQAQQLPNNQSLGEPMQTGSDSNINNNSLMEVDQECQNVQEQMNSFFILPPKNQFFQ